MKMGLAHAKQVILIQKQKIKLVSNAIINVKHVYFLELNVFHAQIQISFFGRKLIMECVLVKMAIMMIIQIIKFVKNVLICAKHAIIQEFSVALAQRKLFFLEKILRMKCVLV